MTALIVTALLRLSNPGWMLIIAVVTVIPLIVSVLPLGLALATLRRDRLHRRVAVPFVAAAAVLVVLAALYPETDDQDDWVPLAKLFGFPSDHAIQAGAYTAGNWLVLAYLATVVWTGTAVLTTVRSVHGPRR
jgi:membrane-associated phospholipid phosphatase